MIQSLRRTIKFFARDTRGATAVEFALNFPIYLTIILFIIEAGRMAYIKTAINHAAEEATRYSLVNGTATEEDIKTKAQNTLIGLDADNLEAVIVTAPVDTTDKTRLVSVTIIYYYKPYVPIDVFMDNKWRGFSMSGESKGFLAEEISVL